MRNSMWRSGRNARVPFLHRILHFNGTSDGIDHAAELDQHAIAGALDHASVVDRDRRVDQIAAQRPQPRERAILVGACQSAEADDIGCKDGREFALFDHGFQTVGPRLSRELGGAGTPTAWSHLP